MSALQVQIEQASQQLVSLYQEVRNLLPGGQHSELMALRDNAINIFSEIGLPTKKNEEWKYTSVFPMLQHEFHFSDQPTQSDANLTVAKDGIKMVFVNGIFQSHLSDMDDLPDGVILQPLSQALKNPDKAFIQALQRFTDEHGFSALNTALFRDGVYLNVSKNTVINKPIHFVYLSNQPQHMSNMRNVIIAGENSQVNIIEQYLGQNGVVYLDNVITQIIAEQAATVLHHKVQQEGLDSFHIGTIDIKQEKDAKVICHSFALGAALARQDTQVDLNAQGADVSLYGLYIGKDNQHIDHHTRVNHFKPHGTSREFYKGIMDDKSTGVFNGKVIVHEHAIQTNADQSNKNILLTDKATIDTKPQLEIFADDVKCTHGATIGQLDEDAVFYLRARGLCEESARQIMLKAFAAEIIESVNYEPLRQLLDEELVTRFGGQIED